MGAQHRRIHLTITGRVQGVSYRAYAQEQAGALGLCGWVRNTPQGAVEICAEGPETSLQRLAAWCQLGPPAALVRDVQAAWAEATGEFAGFAIRW